MAARVLSVNLAELRTIRWRGKDVWTGIFKEPAQGSVGVTYAGLEGDRQADLRVHGGEAKAVYAYAREDYEWWERELGRVLAPGTFGENLTVEGVQASGAEPGERWRAGSSLLEVTEPRLPCFKLGVKMGDQRFLKRFTRAGRPGTYLRVVEEGSVEGGDALEVISRR